MHCLSSSHTNREAVGGNGPWLLIVAAVTFWGAFLRFHDLEAKPLANDEAFSWRLTTYPCLELVRRTAMDVNPPFYYLVLKSWLSVVPDSARGLRALSGVASVFCILTIYVCCLEASGSCEGVISSRIETLRFGAVVSAFMSAGHAFEVDYGQSARMYGMGMWLSAMSSIILLRAMHSRDSIRWWGLYCVVASMFCYTHTFAIFTVIAQFTFSIGDVLLRYRRDKNTCTLKSSCAACILSFSFVASIYSAWIPVLLYKLKSVTSDTFIPPLSITSIQNAVFTWALGFDQQKLVGLLWIGVLMAGVLSTLNKGGKARRACIFFLVQLVAPWIFGLLISFISFTNIFEVRYAAFGHPSLLCLWGVIIGHATSWRNAVCLSLIAISPCLGGAFAVKEGTGRSAVIPAAEEIKSLYSQKDLILVDFPEDVNILRYYLARIGIVNANVQCIINPLESHGHIHHIASLDSHDVMWGFEMPGGRVLQLVRSRNIGTVNINDSRLQLDKRFEFKGAEVDTYWLFVYSKENNYAR